MSAKTQKVTIAHASFWYTNAAGRHKVALQGSEIEVGPEDFERGEKHGAFLSDEPEAEPETEPASTEVAGVDLSAKADDVVEAVGADKEKAAAVLEAEQAKGDKARKGLVERLQAVIAAEPA